MSSQQQLEPPSKTQQQPQVTELKEEKDSLWLKVFLIDSSSNQNDWKASEEYIRKNVQNFVGKPFIITANKKHPDFVREGVVFGKGQETLNQILTAQDKYKIGEIKKVEASGPQYHAYIQITDPKIIKSFKQGHIPRFVSPSVFDPNGTEDGNKMGNFEPLHVAAVDEPAYGVKAYVRGACDGESTKCLNELKSASEGSDNGGPANHEKETKCPCSILETFNNKFQSSSYLKNASFSNDSLSQELQKPETIIAEITPQVETSKLESTSDTNNTVQQTQQTPSSAEVPSPQVEAPQPVEKRGRKSTQELENAVEELRAQLSQMAEWKKTEEEKAIKKAAEEQRATIESAITPEVTGGDEEKRRQIIDNIVGLNFSNEQLQFVLSLLEKKGTPQKASPPTQQQPNNVRSASVNTLVLNQSPPSKPQQKSNTSYVGFFGNLE